MRHIPFAALLVSQLAFAAPESKPIDTPKAEVPEGETYHPMQSFAPLVKAVEPAVVAIEVQGVPDVPDPLRSFLGQDPTMRGEGSGFIISADGMLLTNYHVIEGADQVRARLSDGNILPLAYLGGDKDMDIALLQLPTDRQWPYVELVSSATAEVGDWVVAVGNPLGLGTTVTAGIISAKGRALGHDDTFGSDDFLQTDAAINEGNSGGPLFSLDGKVIGMNTAIIAGANTIGFATSSDLILKALPDLREKGKVARGFLGVSPQSLTAELAESLGVEAPHGALLTEVFKDTPAEKAGLKAGDVVLSLDGKPVIDRTDLIQTVGTKRPGEAVELEIVRGSNTKKVRLVLAERPASGEVMNPRSDPESSDGAIVLGMNLLPLSPQLAAGLDSDQGVLVQGVDRSGPAEGRIEPGDVIVEVNQKKVSSPEQVATLVRRSSGAVMLVVVRQGARQFVVVPKK